MYTQTHYIYATQGILAFDASNHICQWTLDAKNSLISEWKLKG